ncbi:hypothetical protein [Nannocystis pusilla]|uniref:hypothetical protein n=1 Tax=Nannocystis pusilla TaxID=889268 RepID=UPI003B7E5A10
MQQILEEDLALLAAAWLAARPGDAAAQSAIAAAGVTPIAAPRCASFSIGRPTPTTSTSTSTTARAATPSSARSSCPRVAACTPT